MNSEVIRRCYERTANFHELIIVALYQQLSDMYGYAMHYDI